MGFTDRVASLTLLAVLVAGFSNARAEVSAEKLQEIAGQLDKQGQALHDQTMLTDEVVDYTEGLRYDADDVKVLQRTILSQRKPATSAYVVRHLLEPLKDAEPGVVREYLSLIELVSRRFVRYQRPPQYGAGTIRALTIPARPESDSLAALREIDKIQQRREVKLKKDWPAVFRSRQAMELQNLTFALRMLAQDDDADKALARDFRTLVAKASGEAVHLLSVLAELGEQGRASDAQAAFFYDYFSELGLQVKWIETELTFPGDIVLAPNANSEPTTEKVKIGCKLLDAANAFADQAGKKEHDVPGWKEWKAHRDKNRQQGGNHRRRH